MITVLDIVLLWIGAAGSVASLAVYGLTQQWWTNPLGRFLIIYMGVVVLIYAKSVVSVLGGTTPSTSPLSVAVNAMVAALMVYQTATFSHLIIVARRRRRRR